MTAEILKRAASYPYAIPGNSYLYEEGRTRPLPLGVSLSGRKPVLAVGSNQSPEQLARKFMPDQGWGEIPVIRAALSGYDTVYSAHLTGYGSIPATLCPAHGVVLTLFINWLNADQEERMHETEGSENYQFGLLGGLDLTPEVGAKMTEAYLYQGNHGVYAPDNDPVPLAEIPATGRRWPPLGQRELQYRLSVEGDVDTYMLETVRDSKIRAYRTEKLKLSSQNPSLKNFTPIL